MAWAIDNNDKALLDAVSKMGHCLDCKEFDLLYMAAVSEIVQNDAKNEFYYQTLFEEHAESLIKNCKVIKKKNNPKHQPDCWVSINGHDAPVEVKLGKFNSKALQQLFRYMKFYKSEFGVAVGRLLTVELPDNVIFVPLSALEKQL